MTVYVLESSDEWGEEHRLHGVFSTQEKARRAYKILGIDGTITEIELDEYTYVNVTETGEEQLRKVQV